MTKDENGEMWSKADCGLALDYVVNAIMDAVKSGNKVGIQGFGTFEPRERKEKNGVNPSTGEKIVIPAKKSPVFKAGKAFKDMVNSK